MLQNIMPTPLGQLLIAGNGSAITEVRFCEQTPSDLSGCPLIARAITQLQEYFYQGRELFDLPLAPAGTEFQQQVWKQLQVIPYGEVRSYQWQAEALGKPKASRAVGAANGRNPIAIIIPCHRVIGSSGKLTGYAGGLERKKRLLELEGITGFHLQ